MQGIDVLDLAAELRVPTLIAHCRGDMRVPFDEGCKLAAAIPGARFVPLESKNHVLLPDEPAWAVFQAELAAFPRAGRPQQPRAVREAGLTPAEAALLDLVAEGLDNRTIAERLGKSEKTVRNQLSVIFGKLGVHSRSQAIVKSLSALESFRVRPACGTDVPSNGRISSACAGQPPHARRPVRRSSSN